MSTSPPIHLPITEAFPCRVLRFAFSQRLPRRLLLCRLHAQTRYVECRFDSRTFASPFSQSGAATHEHIDMKPHYGTELFLSQASCRCGVFRADIKTSIVFLVFVRLCRIFIRRGNLATSSMTQPPPPVLNKRAQRRGHPRNGDLRQRP